MNTNLAIEPGVTQTMSAPRPTPTPRTNFAEVMKDSVLASADAASRTLPGAPLFALAVRGGGSGIATSPAVSGALGPAASSSAEGPAPTGTPSGTEASSLEGALKNSQDMNLYYLRVQENVNAQNRSFTTISNVLKAEHETVKTAIGNIR